LLLAMSYQVLAISFRHQLSGVRLQASDLLCRGWSPPTTKLKTLSFSHQVSVFRPQTSNLIPHACLNTSAASVISTSPSAEMDINLTLRISFTETGSYLALTLT